MNTVAEWNSGPIPDSIFHILVLKRNGLVVVAQRVKGQWQDEDRNLLDFKGGIDPRYSFTHWLPIPPPPESWGRWDDDPWSRK